ncbi:DUF3244 domain-containing protein [Christiangramia flava]|uniref:Uncharacterized protein n=1 Tax=Christiangramia flava JLT2011 TaxID=1229726 RepID=A0A1L7I9I2_9FLAO|nr:hypothetical protein [Christiangramia flava]APU69884.1 hypothetical protein GRFL_3160 [Christiangramia flava JLT2011]OSS37799.1 hypothetical protein C723_3268 [Christiangramia flava JLT2011]
MKKAISTLVAVFSLLMTANVNAADGLDLKISEQQNLVVNLQDVEDNAVLSLMDARGEVIFKDRFLNEKNYSKTLSFQNLPDGNYTLSLDKTFTISTSVIKKKGNELLVKHENYEFVFKPVFKTYGKKVLVYMANPTETTAEILIFDKAGEQIGQLKTKDLVLKKTFDFKTVPSGEYIVKVKYGEHVFEETVKLG